MTIGSRGTFSWSRNMVVQQDHEKRAARAKLQSPDFLQARKHIKYLY